MDEKSKALLYRRSVLAGSLVMPLTFVAGAQAAPLARLAYDDESRVDKGTAYQGAGTSVNFGERFDPATAAGTATRLERAQAAWHAAKSNPDISPEALTDALAELRLARHAAEYAG